MLLALGDLLLDVIVRLDGPLRPGTDARAATRVDAGGQAANVAAWTVALGGAARFAGKHGGDAGALLARAAVERRGVEVVGPVEQRRAGGVVVSLVGEDGARTMASDRGVAPDLEPDEVDEAWLDGCDGLHLSGYSLLRSPIDEAALRLAAAAHRRGLRVSIDLASAGAMADYGVERFRERLAAARPDLVFCTLEEREAVDGALDAAVRVLKRGADGCVVEAEGERLALPAEPAAVVDTTGAGDALAAGFLLGGSMREAAERGLAAAARCVGQLGAMP